MCDVMVNGAIVDGVNGLCVWCNGLSGNVKWFIHCISHVALFIFQEGGCHFNLFHCRRVVALNN